MSPFVSIIVASYNYEKFITLTLDSLIDQTFTDWEALVIDDGSKDNSVDIIKEYAQKDSRIRLLQHPDNGNRGLSASLQRALSEARGEWTAFCESDDWWEKDFLETLVDESKNSPNNGLIFSDVILEGESPAMEEHCERIRTHFRKGGTARELYLNMCNAAPTFSCVMVKTKLLRKCDFNAHFPPSLDMWLWAQIVSHTEFSFVDKKLSHWRQHPTSYMKQSIKPESLDFSVVTEFHNQIRQVLGVPVQTEQTPGTNESSAPSPCPSRKKRGLIRIFLFILLFLLIYSIQQYGNIYSDDYDIIRMAWNDAGQYSLPSQLQNMYAYYMDWGSRVGPFFVLSTLVTLIGIQATCILQALIISLLFLVCFKIIRKTIPGTSNTLTWVIILGCYFSIKIGLAREGIYYFAASVHYIWPLLPLLAYILISENRRTDKKKSKLWYTGLFLLLFIAASSTEVIAVASLTFTFSLFLLDLRVRKHPLKFHLFSCLISLAGLLFVFCCPGNTHRSKLEHVTSASHLAGWDNLWSTFQTLQRMMTDNLCPGATILFCGALLGMLWLGIRKDPSFKKILPFLFLLLGSLAATLHPSARTPRVYTTFFVLYPVFAALIAARYYEICFIGKNHPNKIKYILLTLAGAAFLICPISNFNNLYKNYRHNSPLEKLNDALLGSHKYSDLPYTPFFLDYKAPYGCQHGNTIRHVYEDCLRKYYALPATPFVYIQIPQVLYYESGRKISRKNTLPFLKQGSSFLNKLLRQPVFDATDDLSKNDTFASFQTSGCTIRKSQDSGEMEIISENADPQILVPYENNQKHSTFCVYIDFTIEQELDCLQLFYRTLAEPTYSPGRVVTSDRSIVKGNNKILLLVSHPDKPCHFRLDPGISKGKYIIHSLKIMPFPINEK